MSIFKVSRRTISALVFGQGALFLGRVARSVTRSPDRGAVVPAGLLEVPRSHLEDQAHPRTTAEIRAGVIPKNYAFPAGNVKRYGAVGDLIANDTASIAQALSLIEATGDIFVHFPPGSYLVDTLTFTHNGTYTFDNATLFANSSVPQKCLVKFTAAYCNVYNMDLNCRWKSNYACALWWVSENVSSPSQSNNFWALSTQNTLLGILFGALSGALNLPQSENYVYGFHSRGVLSVLHSNQPNGFIAFIGGQLASSKNEWDVNNPHIYDFAEARVITNNQGVVRCVGCDLEKTESREGYGFVQTGSNSVTELCECDYEIACQIVKLSAGRFVIRGGGGYWSNGTASCVVLSGASGGQLHISGFTLNKDPSRAGVNTAFLDLGGARNWDITLANLRLENQLNLIFYNGSSTPHVWIDNNVLFCNVQSVSSAGGTLASMFPRVTTDANNLLDLHGTDIVGIDATTWYHSGITRAGSITLNADVPVGIGFFNSFQCAISEQADFTSMDITDLASVKTTGIRCKPGDRFMLSGWFRVTETGNAQVQALFASANGTAQAHVALADSTKFVMNAWVQINGLITVPAECAYMGVGMRGSSVTVRMIGLKVSKLG